MLVLVLYPNWILDTPVRGQDVLNVGTCSISKLDTPVRGQDVLNVGTCSISKLDTPVGGQDVLNVGTCSISKLDTPVRGQDVLNVGTCSISKLDTPVRGQDVLNVGTCSISKLDTPVRGQDVQRMLVLVLYPNWILQSEARTSRECWYLFYIQTGYSSQRPGRPENVGTCSISKLDTPVRGQDVQRMLVLFLYPNWILQSEARTSRECWYFFYIQTGYSS